MQNVQISIKEKSLECSERHVSPFLHTTVWSLHNRKLQKMTKTQPPVVLLSATSVLTTHLQQ